VSPCPLTFEFTLHEPYVFEGLVAWQPLMKMDLPALKSTLADPAFRQRVKDELAVRSRRLFNGDWQKMFVTQAAQPQNQRFDGNPIDNLAREAGKHPLDFMLDLSLSEGLDTLFTGTLLNADEDAVGRLLRDPNSIVSLSDAGAHLTFLCDAGFGLHLLGHWSRDLQALPTEHAVRKLTAEPAALFGIRDRGTIEPGQAADLLLFDPARVGRGRSQRIFDLPAGASRLSTPSRGVHGVWVNGRQIADAQGIIPDAPRAGRVLREFAG
jgi:N-acyl-D-aspartate/D-glutamate deacylase